MENYNKHGLQENIDFCWSIVNRPHEFIITTVVQWVPPLGSHTTLINEVQKRLMQMEDETKTSQQIVDDTILDFVTANENVLFAMDTEEIMVDQNGATVTKATGDPTDEKGKAEDKKEDKQYKTNPGPVVWSAIGGLFLGATGMFFAAPLIRGSMANKPVAASGEAAFGGFGGFSL
jgi:hypothetical protein